MAFCRSKSQPSAPEHCGRERSARRNDAAGAERRPCEFKGSSANQLALLAEAAKGARGKAKGFPPRGATRQGCGAGLGEPSREALHQNRRQPKIQMFAALVCGMRMFVASAVRFRVRFTPPPNPSRVFSEVGGVDVLWGQAQSTPRRSTPRRRSVPPPEGEAPGGFPLGTPPCRGAQGKMSVARRSLTFRAPALAGAEPRTRSRLKCSPFGRLRTKCLVRPCAVFDPRRKVAPMRAARSAATASPRACANKTNGCG